MKLFRKHSNKVVQAKDEDTAPRLAPNLLATKFAERFEEQAKVFQHDVRFTKGLIRYKELMGHIKSMDKKFGAELEDRKRETVQEECSICLEALGPASAVTVTACNHAFHTFCLVQALGNGACTSCPLCRTAVAKLVPKEIEGSSLKLVAKLRINIDQAQDCHHSLLKDLQSKTVSCLREAESLRAKKKLASSASSKKAKLQVRVSALAKELELLQQFGQINADGFAKVCKKIGKSVSAELAETLEHEFVREQGFFKDCHEDGGGLTRALHEELRCISNLLGSATNSSLILRPYTAPPVTVVRQVEA